MELGEGLRWVNRLEGCRGRYGGVDMGGRVRHNISSQTIATPLQKRWPSNAWRARQPRTPRTNPFQKIITEKKKSRGGHVCGQARDRLYYWTPPYSHNRDHTMARWPILCPAVKMKPYSVLCRPSVSLLKPKNKGWVEQNIFIALCSRCRWLRAEWDLWKGESPSQRKHAAQHCDWLKAGAMG